MRKAILLFWPSFVIAGLATIGFFAVFDPHELTRHGVRLFEDKLAAYSVFMIISWAFGALNTVIVIFLNKTSTEINGFCALPANELDDTDAEYPR